MFERYTEKARRVIFFARYEASQFASPYIESEHMLLGLVREDKALAHRFLRGTDFESMRNQIEARSPAKGKPTPTSVDLPLSNECKRALAFAAEEAERLAHKHIGTEHLLLGLLREEQSFAAELLRGHNVQLEVMRKELKTFAQGMSVQPLPARPAPEVTTGSNLVMQATDGQLPAFVGRGEQLDTLIQVLGRSSKKNAVLVGEAGVGKRSIAVGLAQRIAQGNIPSTLAEKMICELDLSQIVGGRRAHSEGYLKEAARQLRSTGKTIFLIDELHSSLATAPSLAATDATDLLKNGLESGEIQCICTALPEDFRDAMKKHHWLTRCFRMIEVLPMTEAEALEVLLSAKGRLERFHAVTFEDDALQAAVRESSAHVKDRYLPDKALDLLDEAAAYVNARRANWPPELIEAQQQLRFISHHMENAVSNHEFEKARFYSDEECKVRQQLSELQKKHDATGVHKVTRQDVVEVLARWLGISASSLEGKKSGDEPRKA
jgi:ATP-dependent Clp protease ATP-binding subunit ClpC